MATSTELQKWQAALNNRIPILGGMRRRKAMDEIESRINDPDVIPLLIKAVSHSDESIANRADAALRKLEPGEACDRLCDLATREPKGRMAKICIKQEYRHTDPQQNVLLLFVTQQLEEYFKEDYEFQHLRPAYDAAGDGVKRHVLEIVRGGDRRCAGFFSTKSKTLLESSEEEILAAINGFLKHKNYSELFQACLQLPLKYGIRVLERLAKTKWTPDDAELASLYKELVRETAGTVVPPPRQPSAESALFERWLVEGRAMAGEGESKLRGMLAGDSPIDGVRAVGALAARGEVSGEAKSAVASSPHWLVRLAGHATGLSLDITRDKADDDNLWIQDLVTCEDVLEFWPAKATPKDRERLAQAPREAFTGRLGGVRKALQLLMNYQIDVLVAKRRVKPAAADAAVIRRKKKQ